MAGQKNQCLVGQCILNTRPSHQQQNLQALLEGDAAQVLNFATIQIGAVIATAFHNDLVNAIEDFDIAVFVSRNAVDGAFRFLGDRSLPAHLQLAVIGDGTSQALNQRVDNFDWRLICSEPYNSEGLLLASDLQQLDGKKIIIFRGQLGRTLLAEEFQKRGADVHQCEVYQRQLPKYDELAFAKLTSKCFPTLVVFTSTEGMANLLQLVDEPSKEKLLCVPWLLISERMRESAVKLGHNAKLLIAAKASDDGIQQTINHWAQQKNQTKYER